MPPRNGAANPDRPERAAIWARVSTDEQDPENQVAALKAFAERRGAEVVQVYALQKSAWSGDHRDALKELLDEAQRGRFEILLVWALDRLSREGPLATLELLDRLDRYGVQVISLQEGWTEASGELRDLLTAVVAWVARMESARRSERVKAGMARAKAQGKQVGRPPGAKDKKKRRTRGYYLRWAWPRE